MSAPPASNQAELKRASHVADVDVAGSPAQSLGSSQLRVQDHKGQPVAHMGALPVFVLSHMDGSELCAAM